MDKRLADFFKIFLAVSNIELEARFGTRKEITRIDFDNVIRKLKSLGFVAKIPSGSYHMNINNEFVNPKTSITQISNIRAQISHLNNIKKYCKDNIISDNALFYRKQAVFIKGDRLKPLDYNSFHFRVNLKQELPLQKQSPNVISLIQKWKESKKIFRFMKRFTFTHPDFPLKIDCSVVKSSKKNKRGGLLPEYTIEAAKVFRNNETYEIEIEMVSPSKSSEEEVLDALIKKFKTVIKYILSGLQETNFPISYTEQGEVLQDYIKILNPKLYKGKKVERRKVTRRDFIGPQSVSLQIININPLNDDIKAPNIRQPYTVTEKADGIRKLLLISSSGNIYFIDHNMKVQFTGMKCPNQEYHKTIMDGEHILQNKKGKYINLYLIFDLYYVNGVSYRDFPFIKNKMLKKSDKFRHHELKQILSRIEFKSIINSKNNLIIRLKKFYKSPDEGSIFAMCKKILHEEGLFEYEIDGLIFTPSNLVVGGTPKHNSAGKATKKSWIWSMKWKPPELNTIDFLVTTKKLSNGQDFMGNIFEDGNNLNISEQLTQYKTLILRVGFDQNKHGFLNPCDDIINENYSTRPSSTHSYKPVPFMPTEPTDKEAWKCNILLENGSNGNKFLYTENKQETFEDMTIVEFRYDISRQKNWQWVPIRVRYDKTADFRSGGRNYGNAYHVANSIWKSIHNPITEEIIISGENIPEDLGDDNVYYKKEGKTITKALKNFHNLYIKKQLILNTSQKGGTLIDLACGKGGDLPKWIKSDLSFVFGVDIARDNIENRLDGACARFLNYKKKYRIMPSCLFVHADSKLDLRSGEACVTEQGKQITSAVFGEGVKDEAKLGKGVYKQYGVGKEGFNVVSCQFALHYFFENLNTLNGFLKNVSETCKVGGYFIGTSYDGKRVFRLLEDKKPNESIIIMHEGKKMWEVKKKYDADTFENDETSVGYTIEVYQESINKTFAEYLVNYVYLERLLENYGFKALTKEEAGKINFPNSIGSFEDLFQKMEQGGEQGFIRKKDYGEALNLTEKEKTISFLNNYFIFKKIHDVNAGQVSLVITETTENAEDEEGEEGAELSEAIKEEEGKVEDMDEKIVL